MSIPELEAYNKKNIDAIRTNYLFESFRFPYGSKFLTGGKLICKHCGKEFKWEDWGRGKSLVLRNAEKHLSKKHSLPFFSFSPYAFKDSDLFYQAFPEAKL